MKRPGRLAPLPPIGLNNRVRRAFWQIAWTVLYRPSPIVAHRWRCFVLRAFGARIAWPVYPYPSARIWAPWNLEMQRGSCLAAEVDCYNVDRISIGTGVTVSQKSYLCTASHDFDNPTFALTGGPITIEGGAWVAANAFIGPGVRVGARAVVLACAVVVRDVDAGMVVGGNPARLLRPRGEFETQTQRQRTE